MSFVLWGFDGLGLLALTAIARYSLANESRHTGWEPYTSLLLFAPLIFCGLAAVLAQRRHPVLFRPGLLAIAVGICGCAVIIYLDHSNRLVQYDRWIQRGMP